MARIVEFTDKGEASEINRHTDVECGYSIARTVDGTFLVLETYGSKDRAIPGKPSQSLLLDEDGAAQLKVIIERAFPALQT